jgi:hypothetical protein
MKKRVILQMEGGLGKQVALTSLIPYFTEKYEEVIIFTSFPQVFAENPNIYRVLGFNASYGYDDYFKDADDIFFVAPYRDSDFRKQRINLIEAACNSIRIEYQNEIMKPQLFLSKSQESYVKQQVNNIGNFLIIQSHGGRNISSGNKPNVMAKDYDVFKMEKVVEELNKKYPNLAILNFALPDEVEIKGTLKTDYDIPTWFGLIRESEGFIAIDSSLQHMSAAWEKKGVVLWGATNPFTFGWEHNINLAGKCPYGTPHCQRPYFVPSADLKTDGILWECPSKKCMDFEIEEIINAVDKLKIKENKTPTLDLSVYISKKTYLN